jgi:hypothetical protein
MESGGRVAPPGFRRKTPSVTGQSLILQRLRATAQPRLLPAYFLLLV